MFWLGALVPRNSPQLGPDTLVPGRVQDQFWPSPIDHTQRRYSNDVGFNRAAELTPDTPRTYLSLNTSARTRMPESTIRA